ncbi:hypothetical protein BDW22DRAFT_1431991 [Trametopsis cervina]|nr:hypothetical protein BDW22DRAFT_1431991 [Trametopsis cervina]
MSSEEESDPTLAQGRKKKRRMRACDMCRRRKVRCDGGQMPNGVCTNCITFKYKCTYVQSAPKRLPDSGYLESLETQMAEMRTLLNKYRQLYPDVEHSDDPNCSISRASPFPDISTTPSSSLPPTSTPALTPASIPMSPSAAELNDQEPELDPSDDEISTRRSLARNFENLVVTPQHEDYLGKSSSMMLLQAALETREQYVAGGSAGTGAEKQDSETSFDTDKGKAKATDSDDMPPGTRISMSERVEFWEEHPWVVESMSEQYSFVFPPMGLIQDLTELYFLHYNLYTPLLHRPTFERNLKESLHTRDRGFGAVVLMVCALGSRASDDPRVLLDEAVQHAESHRGTSLKTQPFHSAGWKWFRQVQATRRVMSFIPANVYDIQVAYFAAVFSWGTLSSQMSWVCVGYGIRLAQVVGAHRKKSYSAPPTVEQELLKRAFWALVYLDRLHSSVLGRPSAIQDEDFDVDLPSTCDDEYWIHPDPAQAFKQPEGRPSQGVFFTCLLRLSQIHAFALRTIYSINKSKALLGLVGQDWQQRIVAEIDSALNRWIDSIPPHLRWDPRMENIVFLNQSACLYTAYYTVQIVVHRPFIPSPRKSSPVSFPSLAICTNAARSCIHVLDEQWRRTGSGSHLHQQYALFSSPIILMLNIWGSKKSITSAESMREMQDVHKAMNMMKSLEPRWPSAGRIWDILSSLLNIGDLPLPERPLGRHKRPHSGPDEQTEQQPSQAPEERQLAGSKRVYQYQQQHQGQPALTPPNDPLPIYSQQLGSLPLHPFSENQAESSSGTDAAWNAMYGAPPSAVPTHSTGDNLLADDIAMQPSIDPSFEALFNMLTPAQYQQSQMSPIVPGALPQHSSEFVQTSSLNDAVWQSLGAGPSAAHASQRAQGDSAFPHAASETLDSDTLEMWSTAPSGFAWEDWGTYVTNFNAPPGNVYGDQSHPG